MIILCKYYQLREQKNMQDGHFISANQKLLYICTEENLMQFETIDDSEIKKIFWASEKEVEFLKEIEEDWSDEKIKLRENEINGKWLIN